MTVFDHLLERHDGHLVIDVPAAGAELGLGRSAAYTAAKAGELPTVTLNGRLVVPVRQLARLLGDLEDDDAPGGAPGDADTDDARLRLDTRNGSGRGGAPARTR